uniref:retinoic acid receptor responder protein 3-like n=1 Tax=Monopterus albus TaxID=43700 RepID=UPI0009B3F2DE|nr:retinoic acid receptor responder protein 3-like [Monopterus albus]
MSVPTRRAVVKKEKLLYVVGTDRWKINNRLDKAYKPRLGCDIVREALARVGEKLSYTVISRNCEHFVTELRYGKSESLQVLFKGGAILLAAGTV